MKWKSTKITLMTKDKYCCMMADGVNGAWKFLFNQTLMMVKHYDLHENEMIYQSLNNIFCVSFEITIWNPQVSLEIIDL
jgi:hypothetical protein